MKKHSQSGLPRFVPSVTLFARPHQRALAPLLQRMGLQNLALSLSTLSLHASALALPGCRSCTNCSASPSRSTARVELDSAGTPRIVVQGMAADGACKGVGGDAVVVHFVSSRSSWRVAAEDLGNGTYVAVSHGVRSLAHAARETNGARLDAHVHLWWTSSEPDYLEARWTQEDVPYSTTPAKSMRHCGRVNQWMQNPKYRPAEALTLEALEPCTPTRDPIECVAEMVGASAVAVPNAAALLGELMHADDALDDAAAATGGAGRHSTDATTDATTNDTLAKASSRLRLPLCRVGSAGRWVTRAGCTALGKGSQQICALHHDERSDALAWLPWGRCRAPATCTRAGEHSCSEHQW